MPSRSSSRSPARSCASSASRRSRGNSGVENTTRNALRVLTLLGRTDVPVAAGAGRPLVRPIRVADHVHGASGLDGAELPEAAVGPVAEGAVELLARLVRDSADPVTLVPTGPLTNVALFVRTHPELLPRIAEISIMGGAIGEGNLTASAEFNIWADPEAAAIVLDCGRPVALVPLEVTHAALFRNADIPRLEALGTQDRPGLRRSAALLRDLPPRALRLGRLADPRRGRGGPPRRARPRHRGSLPGRR